MRRGEKLSDLETKVALNEKQTIENKDSLKAQEELLKIHADKISDLEKQMTALPHAMHLAISDALKPFLESTERLSEKILEIDNRSGKDALIALKWVLGTVSGILITIVISNLFG
jgi:septal ring factor EnvC (AmiA/AmiB activator)